MKVDDRQSVAGLAPEDTLSPDDLVTRLSKTSVFSRCTRQEVVHLLPFLREQHFKPGESVCCAGQPATDTWLVVQGTLRLKVGDDSAREVSDGLIGEEAALGIGSYLSDAVAKDHVIVLALAKDIIPDSLKDRENRALAFCRSVLQVFTSAKFSSAKTESDDGRLTALTVLWKTVGWVAAAAAPVALLEFTSATTLKWEQRQLAAALLSAAILWVFRLVPPYVAGLLVTLVCVTLGIASTTVVLSGFASSSFFLALSVFSLGAVLIESGVITRLYLTAMKHCPRSAFCYDFLVLLSGVMLTPVVPSVHDRVRVLTPLGTETAENLGAAPGSRETTRLALSVFMGLTLFSPMFLTGGALNLALYGSLPDQVQDGFPWLRWTIAALAALVVVLAAYTAISAIFFRNAPTPRVSQRTIEAQLRVLGPIRPLEWLAVGGAVLFLGAVSTQSLHKIDHRLIALSVICGYLVLGALGKEQLKVDIDWSSLILLGTLIGLIATIISINLHTVVADHLIAFSDIMKYHQLTFIAILAAVVWLASFWIPVAGALVALAAVPLGIINGVNPWIIVFVILLMNDSWFFPSQSEAYRTFRELLRSHTSYDEKLFLRFNAGALLIRVAALAVSISYWQYLRML